jgi:hypothetical protein
MRRCSTLVALMLGAVTTAQAQDTIPAPGKSYSAMYQRFEVDDQGRAAILGMRWNRWQRGSAAFEGSIGLLNAGGPGGIAGEAGAVYIVNDAPVTLLLRGGVAMLAVTSGEEVMAPVGGYAGVALLVGTGRTNLRLEVARHEYMVRQDNIGGWILGIGLAFTPRTETPRDRCR